jgi:hypothetical protein
VSPSIRNVAIHLLIAAFGLILASRIVTVALLIMHAPEDAEPYFYLKQVAVSAICIVAIAWLWNKRAARQEPG